MSKGVYAGVLTEKPIYGNPETYSLSVENLDKFFDIWNYQDNCDISPINNTTQLIVATSTDLSVINIFRLTAKQTITNFYIEFLYSGSSSTIAGFKVKNQTIKENASGSDMTGNINWTGTLLQGESVQFTFSANGVTDAVAYIIFKCDPIEITPINGYETVSIARKVNNFYVPAIGPIPVYEEVTYTNPILSSSNYTSYYFNAITDLHDYGITFTSAFHGGLRFKPKNIGTHSSEGGYGFVTLHDLKNVEIYCKYTTETNCDKVSFLIGDEKILDAVSGTFSEAIIWQGDIPKNTVLDFFYTKDGSQNASNEAVYWEITCDPSTYTVNEITDYEQGIAARKIKKGYVSINGIAREFFSAEQVKYTGNYTVEQITHNNQNYNLYTLTSSGTLTLNDSAEVWMCGGGGDGSNANSSSTVTSPYVRSGGGGGGGYISSGSLEIGEYIVSIGAANADTTISQNSTVLYTAEAGESVTGTNAGGDGGSGGGRGYRKYTSGSSSAGSVGTGAGVSTYPFGITSLKAHSAGGTGGQVSYISSSGRLAYTNGSIGGSNGSNGTTTGGTTSAQEGGGTGGKRASTSVVNGGDATFYGSGGGGGAYYLPSGATEFFPSGKRTGSGGSGYQGVCYLLIPA